MANSGNRSRGRSTRPPAARRTPPPAGGVETGRPAARGGTKRPTETSAATRILEARRRQRKIGGAIAAGVVLVAGGIVAAVLATGGSPAATTTTTSPGTTGPTSTTTPATTTLPKLVLLPLSTLGPLKSPGSAGPAGPEGVPVPNAAPLSGLGAAATGQVVDGISCETSEQTLFHIHAHLTIFVDGQPRQVPSDIGIPGACLYWLHTHAPDGIIHIESPIVRTFTVGNFFDEWGVPLGPDQLGPYKGHVTVLYNGQVLEGDPRSAPLEAHAQIQLEVGTPLVAPVQVTFPGL